MRRMPAAVGLLLAIATALVVALTGPLALFNPPFVLALQDRHTVDASFTASPAQVEAVTLSFLGDIYLDGAFDAPLEEGGEPFLDATERSHMQDVSRLVRLLLLVDVVALVVALMTGWMLRGEARRIGASLLGGAAIVGGAALVVALAFALAFEPTFLAFHAVFFPPDTYLFPPGSRLITLFPEPFWYDAALAAGIAIIASATVVSVAGWRLMRRVT
jgi:integral membrane protein (TIGR01906 family)